ncbi:MAG: SPOR domain-containing protein, partial [Tardiphaga sp.]|uniref:SPOR domain-containing protein n=1 Tax=Tardiphaga sp. TaxID=1926292 RepID=UPI00198D447B
TDHHHAGSYPEPADPARYDDALYGQPDPGYEQPQPQNYAEDPYAYQDAYADEPAQKRRGGLMTVGVVLALAVVGTGAAFAYRTYIGSPRSGEPPVIRADTGPNKIVPPSSTDANAKLIQDRLGAAPEKMVSREETPVNVQDASKAGGPRVVFPPLNQNANPPSTASVAPAGKPMVGAPAQGGDEPRKIRTFAVKGDQTDPNATPAARQAPARLTGTPPAAAPARPANAPISLSPQAAPAPAAPARVANNAPQAIAPATTAGGGYLVQIASQRSESEAAASFKALQGKYPSVLGSRTPTIKKADLGEKGTYYRAMVGPFGSSEEAAQMCGSLKSAGGSCVVQRN